MRNLFFFVCILACFGARAQASDTTVIKDLELKMKTAVLQHDTAAFFELFAPEALVNNPLNMVATLPTLKQLMRAFSISYSSYDVVTEKIVIVENIAMSMGQEVVVPKDNANHLGKTVTRRYTNIWMKRRGAWKMIGRQATEVVVQ